MRVLNFLKSLTLALVLACCTTGCFTVDMLFKVKPDGSGTIEVTSTVKKDFVEQLAMMSGAEGEGGADALFTEAELQKQADKLGPGVKLVRHERISTADAEGVKAFYTFTDIGALRADAMGAAPGGSQGGEGGDNGVNFAFQKAGSGKPSVISARFPQPDMPDTSAKEESTPPPPLSVDDPQFQMVAQMFAGLKVKIALDVEGKLIRSNAPKVVGNRSTLMEVDFDKLLANPEKLGMLMATNATSLADLQKLTADVPGLVIPTVEELRIEFEGK